MAVVTLTIVGMVECAHFGDDVDNFCSELVVVFDAEGMLCIAQETVGGALSVVAFDKQAVGGELVDVGVVGALRIARGFHFDGDQTLTSFEQVIGLPHQAVFVVNEGGNIGECTAHVGGNGGAPGQPAVLAGALCEPPDAPATEQQGEQNGRRHGTHPYQMSAVAMSPPTASVMAMVRSSCESHTHQP